MPWLQSIAMHRWMSWLQKHRLKAIGLAGLALVLVHALLGFVLLPWLMQTQLPRWFVTQTGNQLEFAQVSFNPYLLRLQVHGFRMSDPNGSSLMAVEDVSLRLRWDSVWQRSWNFEHMALAQPHVTVRIDKAGAHAWSVWLASLSRLRPATSPDGSNLTLPRLNIDSIHSVNGVVSVIDQQAGYTERFESVDMALSNISSLPARQGRFELSAGVKAGGKLHLTGQASVSPLQVQGELRLQQLSLPGVAVYLKRYTYASVAAGQLDAQIPFEYAWGPDTSTLRVVNATLALQDVALSHEGQQDAFATLTRMTMTDIHVDTKRREVVVGDALALGGRLSIKRDQKGELDLARLMRKAAGAAAAPAQVLDVQGWRVLAKHVRLDQVAINATDETSQPALSLSAKQARLDLQLKLQQGRAAPSGVELQISDGALSLQGLVLKRGTHTEMSLASLKVSQGQLDTAKREILVGQVRAEGGELVLRRDTQGRLILLAGLPVWRSTGPPWSVQVLVVDAQKFAVDLLDDSTRIHLHARDAGLTLGRVSSNRKQPIPLTAQLRWLEGGVLKVQGQFVPDRRELQAKLIVEQMALKPFQPLLTPYMRLHIQSGVLSASGQLNTSFNPDSKSTALPPKPATTFRFDGRVEVADLELQELSHEVFATLGHGVAEHFSLSLGPDRLLVPDLQLAHLHTKLVINPDHRLNAARLLVQAAQPDVPPQPSSTFPVLIQRVRIQQSKLDFADLSLKPQFGAHIDALRGTITSLSSDRQVRSQLDLEGRVQPYGLVRISGELQPYNPGLNSDLHVVFNNVDMVPASPYAMKFAGYSVTQGKMSLDLHYQLHEQHLQGSNQVVIDQLTLGERVDSPDAFKLPLLLAIAILKDRDGRIDLNLPVSGELGDPTFSYREVIVKALGHLLSRLVAAPFQALADLFGIKVEKLEQIAFAPGSARLLPPEQEKLVHVAQLLLARPELNIQVPSAYSASDASEIKRQIILREVSRRAGLSQEAADENVLLDWQDPSVRAALNSLYLARSVRPPHGSNADAALQDPEQQLAYLVQSYPLDASVVRGLGQARSGAVLELLQAQGLTPERITVQSPSINSASPDKVLLPLTLRPR